MSQTMRAIAVKGGKGPATALYVDHIAKPLPAAGQALVKIRAFGLNRMDLLQREGLYPVPPQAPETIGVEFSGVVESLGGDAPGDFKTGDEVFGLAYGGAYAEYIVVSTKMLIHKPKHLSWEEAAGVPETWITASQALFLIGDFQAGQSVLWHAGASSVSISGIQLAKDAGAKAIYATAGSAEKAEFLEKEMGVTAAFNYKTQDWAAEIQKATGGAGVNLTVDFIGATYFQGNLDVAARDGRIVLLGLMGGGKLPDGVNIAPLLMKRIRFEGSTLRSRDEEYQGKLRDILAEHALPRFGDGTFKVFVEKVFPFEQIVQAHQLLESNTTKGKIICVIE
ncbi:quinone oxidoreductase [Penicillium hispanicum]|uniref:quinone oxidoreductase n=1 Tax=Penicillium hispanicum TaxID=1080232 RepID=UPI002541F6D7|nr:quinone oxidoreductase [Penicillium hispanicum]KAJ5573441.1 quinone oxidoreductase [Penicillium hispanicum]